MAHEIELSGGNTTPVVRVGDRVHREAGPWTPAVHALLDALHAAGIHQVPRAFGLDDRGREVLSFVAGDPVGYPLPDFVWADAVLADAGALLRRMHDATLGLAAEAGRVWRLPRHEPAEVVCHNDFAPYNLTFVDGRLAGVFDFDTASPGPRLWDLAYLAYRMVPLGQIAGTELEGAPDDVDRRLALLIEAYGLPVAPRDVLAMALRRLDDLAEFTRGRARDTGDPRFDAHVAGYVANAAWIRRRLAERRGAADSAAG